MSKKTIYIIIIVICFAGMAGVLYYGFGNTGGGTTPPSLPTSIGQTADTSSGGTGASGAIGGAPSVFPVDTKFDWSLLDSSTFKSLQGVPDLTLDPSQVGRDNPFSPAK